MKRYVKGARSERELLAMLQSRGYSVMRAAGSGVSSVAPDIIAIKDGKGLAFECKAWQSNLSIEKEKVSMLKGWRDNTRMQTMIAWRVNGKGWLFISLDELSETGKNFTVTMKRAGQIGRKIEHILY